MTRIVDIRGVSAGWRSRTYSWEQEFEVREEDITRGARVVRQAIVCNGAAIC